MNPRRLSLYVACLCVLSAGFLSLACASKPGIPDWVRTGKAEAPYKALTHMIGIAQGTDAASASDRARAEIAKQFSVKVQGYLEVIEEGTGVSGDKGTSWLSQISIQDLTRTYTEETIQGIEIAEVWTNAAGTETWALAVLRRSPAMMRLTTRISDLDEQIQHLYRTGLEAGDMLGRIRPLAKAHRLMNEREILNQQLSVVNYAGVGIEPEVGMSAISEALTAALGGLNVVVEIAGDPNKRVRNAIVTSLTNGKLRVQKEAEGAHIIVRGTVEIEETNQGNTTGFVFAKISVALALIDTRDDRTFGQVEHSLRDGAATWRDAQDKTLTKLVARLVADFNARMSEYLSP